jgi:hypothetical protein
MHQPQPTPPSQSDQAPPKQAYIPPQFTVHGKVAEITRTNNVSGNPDSDGTFTSSGTF